MRLFSLLFKNLYDVSEKSGFLKSLSVSLEEFRSSIFANNFDIKAASHESNSGWHHWQFNLFD
jgi:hypothetical protein